MMKNSANVANAENSAYEKAQREPQQRAEQSQQLREAFEKRSATEVFDFFLFNDDYSPTTEEVEEITRMLALPFAQNRQRAEMIDRIEGLSAEAVCRKMLKNCWNRFETYDSYKSRALSFDIVRLIGEYELHEFAVESLQLFRQIEEYNREKYVASSVENFQKKFPQVFTVDVIAEFESGAVL